MYLKFVVEDQIKHMR